MTEAALSVLSAYNARPTVRVNGEESPMLTELVIGMQVTEQEGGLSSLELRLSNWASDTRGEAGLAFEDEALVSLGKPIEIYSGDVAGPKEIFRGKVSGFEAEFPERAPPELVLFAEDAFQQARLRRRTVVHEDVSVADLANSLARDVGLTPVVTGFTQHVGTRVQLNESDLAFLRRLLRRYDGDLQVVGTEMHVSPRSDVRRGEITVEYPSQLQRATVLADLAHQCTDVTVSGWDAKQGSRISAKASGESLGPGVGRAGASVLADAFGERSEHVGHLAAENEEEATALANAIYDAGARRFVRIDGTAEGNPAIRVGTHLRVSELSPRLDNVYYVTRACHRFDEKNGYDTQFEAECAYLGRP